jgi:hypothetical protein
MLVLERLHPNHLQAEYAAVSLDPERGSAVPRTVARGDVFAEPSGERSKHRPAASYAGTILVTASKGDEWALDVRDPSETEPTPPRRVALGAYQPTAVQVVRDTMYVGAREADGRALVVWADLLEPAATLHVLSTVDGHTKKAFDLFAVSGRRLLAIDDVVWPVLADWVELDPRGRPVRTVRWSLPPFANGSYHHATVAGRGNDTFTIYALGAYSIMSGWGQDLVVMDVRGDQLATSDESVNGGSPRRDSVVVLEEHSPRTKTDGARTLLAGDSMTDWTGVAVAAKADRVLVASGSRGLLSFAIAMPPASRPDVVAVDGKCLDVRIVDDLIFVLAEDRAGTFVLALDGSAPGAFQRRGTWRVGVEPFDRFVP